MEYEEIHYEVEGGRARVTLARPDKHNAMTPRLLEELTPDQRIVFELFELEEMTCPAIAESLGIPLGTVYTRLRAARAALTAKASAFSEVRS